MAVILRESETVPPRPARRRSAIAMGDGEVTRNRGKGDEGLYEASLVYKLLTWRPKKGEQEEKEEKKEEEEKEIGEKGR